jgi:PHD/YefM family antitoxin component YafN of YafNO toxin-antitoxin module
MKEMSITETRNQILNLPGELGETGMVKITKRGKHVLTIVSADLYETIMETLEIMDDDEAMAALRKSVRQFKEGKTQTLREVRQELGI